MSVRRHKSLICATVFVCLALTVHIVGFSAEYWVSWSSLYASGRSGLWRSCSCERDICFCTHYTAIELPHWFRAVQAMMCLGLIGQVITAGLAIFTVAKDPENKQIRLAVFGLSIASGIVIWIGMIVYILKINRMAAVNVDFSVFLCAAGGIMSAMSACSFGTGYIPQGSLPPKEERIVLDA